MKIDLIEVNQPIGTFYMACLPARFIADSCAIVRRDATGKGVQRVLVQKRVNEIAAYTEDPDATFPTSIIIAVYSQPEASLRDGAYHCSGKAKFGEIIDGQHRIEGLKRSNRIDDFQMPVILMFDLVEEEKAYVFSIINSKQRPVQKSLIYDLFNLTEKRSPQKTCHEIARLTNSDEQSPYFKRLKMLGKKEDENASLSQGSFVKYLLPLVSKKPDQDLIDIKLGKPLEDDPALTFRYYFIKNEDQSIYKILLNLFKAVASTFELEWKNPDRFILSKTTGYGALMRALPVLIAKGSNEHNLSEKFFNTRMDEFKQRLHASKLALTSSDFPSNEHQQARLAEFIIG